MFFTVVALFGLTSLIAARRADAGGHGHRAVDRHHHHGPGVPGDATPRTPPRSPSACSRPSPPGACSILGQTLGAASFALGDPGLAAEVLTHPEAFAMAGVHLEGLVALCQGFMLTCMIWAAASAELIDQRFERAAYWALAGAMLSFFGFIHAGRLGPAGGEFEIGFASGWRWSVGYALAAAFFALMKLRPTTRSKNAHH